MRRLSRNRPPHPLHYPPTQTTQRTMVYINRCASAGHQSVHHLSHHHLLKFLRHLHETRCFKLALPTHLSLYILNSLIQSLKLLRTRKPSRHLVGLTLTTPIGNQFFLVPLQTTQAPFCRALPKFYRTDCQHATLNRSQYFIQILFVLEQADMEETYICLFTNKIFCNNF